MNSPDHDQPLSALPGDASPADEAAPKPRRKRSPRAADLPADVAAAAAVSASVTAAALDPALAPSADEVFKPKRPRRKVGEAAEPAAGAADVPVHAPPAAVAQAAADADGAAMTTPAVPAEAARPAKPRRRAAAAVATDLAADPAAAVAVDAVAASAANTGAGAGMPAAGPATLLAAAAPGAAPAAAGPATLLAAAAPGAAPAAAGPPAAVATTTTDAATAPSTAEPGDAAQPAESAEPGEADGPRRRNRNRRRGRRSGADRALRDDGTPADPALPAPTATATGAWDDDGDDDGDDPADGAADGRAGAAPADAPRAAPLDAADTFAAVLSGDYDAEPALDASAASAEPERRVLAAEPDAPKLHKVLAQAGIGSRRDMEELIAEGQVMVNGQPAHTGQRISFGDRISVAGKMIKVRIAPPPPRIIAYHKPVGEVVTHDDPQHRPTVFRRLPRLPHGKWQSVGRLDINTEGLLLFTNSGELANQLMHPRFGVEREYAVRVLGTLEAEARNRLIDGVEIDGQRAGFKSIEDGGGEGVNHWYRVVITEGRNREVRKLFDKVGLGVSRLIRIRYGCVVLPRGLRRGLFVDLNQAEVQEVRRLAGAGREQPGAGAAKQPPAPREQANVQPAGGATRDGPGPGRNNNRRNGPAPQRAERDRADRPARSERPERADRPDRQPDRPVERPGERQGERPVERPPARNAERRERPPRQDGDGEHENFAAIPNPLMQTFDKRAIREARAPRREIAEDGPIPNPLEQTYDKRFVQKPQGFGGAGGGGRKGGGAGGPGGGQPDPMKTSLGYIGADAFVRKFQGNGGGGGGGGGGGRRGGSGGGGGFGGGGGGNNRRGGR